MKQMAICNICGKEKPIVSRVCWSENDKTPLLQWCEECDNKEDSTAGTLLPEGE